jgi:hypothetical protein
MDMAPEISILSIDNLGIGMSDEPEERAYIDHLMKIAVERWGTDEVEQLGAAIERIGNAIWTIEGFKLESEEEPKPAGGG